MEQNRINPYDLSSVGKSLKRNGYRKVTALRGQDPYNAGGIVSYGKKEDFEKK